MDNYDFKGIEAKWQQRWEDSDAFVADEKSAKPKRYILEQFPYPSGQGLHMGHCSIYTIGDIIARHARQLGFEVLHPMGWDAFGLPTENHAIKVGIHPRIITDQNTANFRRQMKALGWSYDWDREIDTTDPDYMRWTQWIWKTLYEKGLCYKAETDINWCDSCKVGIAHEEVTADGLHERCEEPVRRRRMSQWMFKITEYAQSLLDGLDDLPEWPEMSRASQRNWMGRSRGAHVTFSVVSSDETIEVFTTRPDTLFGATYMVLAPEHALVPSLTTDAQRSAVEAYQKEAAEKSDLARTELTKEKTGVFTGAYATNPVNGAEIPIWIADYVLISYGSGAIMSVPGHDERDFEFATEFNLPIPRVLTESPDGDATAPLDEAFSGEGWLCNSRNDDGLVLDGLSKTDAIERTIEWLAQKGIGREAVTWKLRDWVFARQRYWGEPFPLVTQPDGTVVLMDDSDLPLTLPDVENYQPTDTGKSPLSEVREWIETPDGERESDTMPGWAGSSWYWLRFMDPHNRDEFASLERQRVWGQVHTYVGGTEHLNLHDLYSRFWNHALHDLGLVAVREPFERLLHQGMVLGNDGKKMSKSKGNGKSPDEVLDSHGADVLRLHLSFLGPPEAIKIWNDEGLDAQRRFLERLQRVVERATDVESPRDLEVLHHKTVAGATRDYERNQFNTVIAKLMELTNALTKHDSVPREIVRDMLTLLSPLAPHFADEMGERLGLEAVVSTVPFPTFDPAKTVDDEVEIVLQVNGKIRDRIHVPSDLDKGALEELARQSEQVAKHTEGKTIRKVIAVPRKLVNVVVG